MHTQVVDKDLSDGSSNLPFPAISLSAMVGFFFVFTLNSHIMKTICLYSTQPVGTPITLATNLQLSLIVNDLLTTHDNVTDGEFIEKTVKAIQKQGLCFTIPQLIYVFNDVMEGAPSNFVMRYHVSKYVKKVGRMENESTVILK